MKHYEPLCPLNALLGFSEEKSTFLAVHDAGHRQEGFADALLHEGILLLPLQGR